MFIQFLFIFVLGLIIGALSMTKAKNEEIARLTNALASGKILIDKTKEVMAGFLERNKEIIFDCFTDVDLLRVLIKRYSAVGAPTESKRLVPFIEVGLAVDNDHTAYILMTSDTYDIINKEKSDGHD
jgi:hypothetical protein